MGKHTPGPWSVIDDTPDFYHIAIGKPGDQFTIADVYGDLPEAPATAHLVAAAPDLLTAAIEAKAAMDSIWRTNGADDQWIYDEMGSELSAGYFSLRAAIAKATA